MREAVDYRIFIGCDIKEEVEVVIVSLRATFCITQTQFTKTVSQTAAI